MWPIERYELVLASLIDEHDVMPIIFGGSEDKEIGDRIIRSLGRGINAAGQLSHCCLSRCDVEVLFLSGE